MSCFDIRRSMVYAASKSSRPLQERIWLMVDTILCRLFDEISYFSETVFVGVLYSSQAL